MASNLPGDMQDHDIPGNQKEDILKDDFVTCEDCGDSVSESEMGACRDCGRIVCLSCLMALESGDVCLPCAEERGLKV